MIKIKELIEKIPKNDPLVNIFFYNVDLCCDMPKIRSVIENLNQN